jgi:DNA invertase Pin-like site-specific DNA recombinase
MRTWSAVNVGPDKDSERRQRAAIESYARAAGITIADWYYDAAVSGSDHIQTLPGFKAMLERIAGNGVRSLDHLGSELGQFILPYEAVHQSCLPRI